MEAIQLVIEACFWILGAFWGTVVALFWIGIVLIALSFIAFIFRRRAPLSSPSIDPVEAIRKALRSGELDADIARVEQRNRSRGTMR